jgi:hypothetical protein
LQRIQLEWFTSKAAEHCMPVRHTDDYAGMASCDVSIPLPLTWVGIQPYSFFLTPKVKTMSLRAAL